MPVVPSTPRFKVETLDSNITRITIPSRKNWSAILVSGLILIPWTNVELGTLGIIFRTIQSSFSEKVSFSSDLILGWAMILIWLCLWTILGAFPLYPFLWYIVGKEVIDVGPNNVTIARKIFSFSRPKEYDGTYIKDLRVSQSTYSMRFPWGQSGTFWGMDTGNIAFDYGAKTFRFGSGLDEAGAKIIFSEITARYPQYLPRAV